MNVRSYQDLFNELKNYMIANQDKITDFNDGSIVSTIFEGFARILERFYIDTRIGYSNNLKAIPFSVFDFTKKNGVKATVPVQFSRVKPLSTQTPIWSGTKISAGSYSFTTSSNTVIPSDSLESGIVWAQAEKTGLDYNVPEGAITTIDSILSTDVVIVTNVERASGGTNEETETEVLSRFKEFINGLQGTNNYGIKSGVLSVEGVRSTSTVEHFPPLDDIYNVSVYVDDGTGNLSTDLKNDIEKVINGDDTKVNPGRRAAGINVRILPADIVPINVSLACAIYRIDNATATYEIEKAIKEYINGLKIGDDVVLTSIILLLRRISYIKDVHILLPETNIVISNNQIARFNTISIELEAV